MGEEIHQKLHFDHFVFSIFNNFLFKYRFYSFFGDVISVHMLFSDRRLIKDELKSTSQAIEKTHTLICNHKGSSDLIAEVATLFTCIK